MNETRSNRRTRPVLASLFGLLTAIASVASDLRAPAPAKIENRYPAASQAPHSQKDWEKFQNEAEDRAPEDEAMGGRTAAGTPVHQRNEHCFPPEARNLFWEVDMVFNEASGKLEPFDYRNGEFVDEPGRDAVRGQNTWMLWAEGNETFWNWLQQNGYGLVDFMVLLDSRKRGTRFKDTGMINQPGMKSNRVANELGLFLDVAEGEKARMIQPEYDKDAGGVLAKRPEAPGTHTDARRTELFEPYDRQAYARIMSTLAQDGVDTGVYGYPSGVVGLRLFPNPDFFGKTKAAKEARDHWKQTVQSNPEQYYESASLPADPKLVRPFRVGMSCAFCHVGPHPLNAPENVEEPGWANLSSVIGNQYWTTDKIFANLLQADKTRAAEDNARPVRSSFLRQFLASQQPGTVDTSLISTDHINNANTIISVFDVPSRLQRAQSNQTEKQSAANLQLPSIEELNQSVNPRHTPRILIDGADSVGAYGALARVYLNIGTHSDQWALCHNPVVGFKPQRPFSIATLKAKSVYWNAAELARIPMLAKFFTHVDRAKNKNVASPMKLSHAPGGAEIIAAERAEAALGRAVFIDHCAICHSSKQPSGFELEFSREWSKAPAPKSDAMTLTLPYDFTEWRAFKESSAYATYRDAIREIEKNPRDGKDFIEDNFLSSEVRIPVTLVGTNSGRAVATNAMRGQVWDNFSSEDYKTLAAVGPVRFFNPYSRATLDESGSNNDYYFPPAGGPGYYRPASLISLWATAPYFHNNALGIYTHVPSVASRLEAFDDGIERLLNREYRLHQPSTVDGDMRFVAKHLAGRDVGMIYRTTETTELAFNAKFVRPLLVGVLGEAGVAFATLWLWVALAIVFAVLALFARPRHVGFVLTVIAVLAAVIIVIGRFDRIGWHLWLIPGLGVAAALFFFLSKSRPVLSRVFFIALALGSVWVGHVAHEFAAGERGGIALGPIPRGTPVNLIMNMNPEAPTGKLLRAVTALIRGIYLSGRIEGEGAASEAARLKKFEDEAGQALLEASKCPDFVLDRGHWFGEDLSVDQKRQLKAFLKTL